MRSSALVLFFLVMAPFVFSQVPLVDQGAYISTGTIDGKEFNTPVHFFVMERSISLEGHRANILSMREDAGNLYLVLDQGIEVIYYRARGALDVIDRKSRRVIVTLQVLKQITPYMTRGSSRSAGGPPVL